MNFELDGIAVRVEGVSSPFHPPRNLEKYTFRKGRITLEIVVERLKATRFQVAKTLLKENYNQLEELQ